MKRIGMLFGVVIIVLVLSGCAGGGQQTLNIFTWADNFNEEIIREFEERYDVRVTMSVYSSNEAMFQKLQASPGQFDIIQPSDYMVEALIREGMLERLNKENIPNLAKVHWSITDTPYDPERAYTVLYTFGVTGITYNTNYVKESPTGWADLWNDQFTGRVVLLDDPREVIGMALLKNGFSNNTTDQEEIDQAIADLKILHKNVLAYDTDTIKQKFITEDAWIGTVWSGDAVFIQRDNPNVEFMIPKDGATIWADTTAIPKGAPNKELAEKFINFILDPEISARNFEDIGYINPNLNAREFHDVLYTENPIIRYLEERLDEVKLEWLRDLGEYTLIYDEAFLKIRE